MHFSNISRLVKSSPIKMAATEIKGPVTLIGIESVQGPRPSMEDRYVYVQDPVTKFWFVAVYDGHGGAECASALVGVEALHKSIFDAIKEGPNPNTIASVFKKAYATWDLAHKEEFKSSGSTAVVLLISPDGTHLFIANVGDSKATVWQEGTKIFETTDHNPTTASETKRITDLGGQVIHGRVAGALAVSRAFGDYSFRTGGDPDKWVVSVAPDMTYIQLASSLTYTILLASDGLWVAPDCDGKGADPHKIERIVHTTVPKEVCRSLVRYALHGLDSYDNVTAVLLRVRTD